MASCFWCTFWRFELLLMAISYCEVECRENEEKSNTDSLVEVRAVFINCAPDERQDSPDSQIMRFQRQELFKHNVLNKCAKKLALTIKMTSEPQGSSQENIKNLHTNAGEEYIPIDHVFEGSDRKRLRLLNPYVLRLQREKPRQAYKLHRIDTVTGVLTPDFEDEDQNSNVPDENKRNRRDADLGSPDSEDGSVMAGAAAIDLEHDDPNKLSYSIRIGRLQDLFKEDVTTPVNSNNCGLKLCHNDDRPTASASNHVKIVDRDALSKKIIDSKRMKRNNYENSMEKTPLKENYYFKDTDSEIQFRDENRKDSIQLNLTPKYNHNKGPKKSGLIRNKAKSYGIISAMINSTEGWIRKVTKNFKMNKIKRYTESYPFESSEFNSDLSVDNSNEKISKLIGRDFALYEIGSPDLWYVVKLQLFEKMSTPDGKTVWNDLTKGEQARISSTNPEWSRTDMHVQYKPAEWLPRDEFSLPTLARLCLLEPLSDQNDRSYEYEAQPNEYASYDYIVVPKEDVVYKSKFHMRKRQENVSEDYPSRYTEPFAQFQDRHLVEIRVSRAITGDKDDKFKITSIGNHRFLMLPHHQGYRSQIDLEVKADDNQLVRLGCSGRLATIVTDCSRKTRSVIHVQATNTGLASSNFKVVARECGPELSSVLSDLNTDEITAGPVLIPPQHTHRLRLEIPVLMPVSQTKCNVALLNEDDEAVAVRDVTIKKGDRCFCVWHCDCVCLGDDPKLLCREMSETQQLAAGLSVAERPRYSRSICYPDIASLDFFTCLIGIVGFLMILVSTYGVVVISLLTLLGRSLTRQLYPAAQPGQLEFTDYLCFIKGIVGICVPILGQLGFEYILTFPFHLHRYYENKHVGKNVIYDEMGWPISPDKKERTVRIVSCPQQFLINMFLFVIMPYILLKELLKSCLNLIKPYYASQVKSKIGDNTGMSHNQRDIQKKTRRLVVKRKYRKKMLSWMSPSAEKLASEWLHFDGTQVPQMSYNTKSPDSSPCECKKKLLSAMTQTMRPLLYDPTKSECSLADSEEDTHYVLMQMQKSKESLARSQRKIND